MISKISLTAAFLLMVAPPMVYASNCDATNPGSIARKQHVSPSGMVVAQNANGIYEHNQSNEEAPDSANDNSDINSKDNSDNADLNSKDNSDDNQNAGGDQADQQNAAGNDQPVPPQVNGTDTDQGDAQQAPPINAYPAPMNPYQ